MMKLFFLFMALACSSSKSLNTETPKFCINCKYYLKNGLLSKEFGRCLMFKIEEKENFYLITGKKRVSEQIYYHCSTAREFDTFCGKNAKYFEPKL